MFVSTKKSNFSNEIKEEIEKETKKRDQFAPEKLSKENTVCVVNEKDHITAHQSHISAIIFHCRYTIPPEIRRNKSVRYFFRALRDIEKNIVKSRGEKIELQNQNKYMN